MKYAKLIRSALLQLCLSVRNSYNHLICQPLFLGEFNISQPSLLCELLSHDNQHIFRIALTACLPYVVYKRHINRTLIQYQILLNNYNHLICQPLFLGDFNIGQPSLLFELLSQDNQHMFRIARTACLPYVVCKLCIIRILKYIHI